MIVQPLTANERKFCRLYNLMIYLIHKLYAQHILMILIPRDSNMF